MTGVALSFAHTMGKFGVVYGGWGIAGIVPEPTIIDVSGSAGEADSVAGRKSTALVLVIFVLQFCRWCMR